MKLRQELFLRLLRNMGIIKRDHEIFLVMMKGLKINDEKILASADEEDSSEFDIEMGDIISVGREQYTVEDTHLCEI